MNDISKLLLEYAHTHLDTVSEQEWDVRAELLDDKQLKKVVLDKVVSKYDSPAKPISQLQGVVKRLNPHEYDDLREALDDIVMSINDYYGYTQASGKKPPMTVAPVMTIEERQQKALDEMESRRIRKVIAALEQMKGQFDNSEMYIRELIQNAVDAGSTRIDVRMRYDDAKKKAIVSVNDNGCGMNLDKIRGKLLTLFESDKEGDITKIGRFGIGFVSVFAQKGLEQVVVHTSDGTAEHVVKLLPPALGWKGEIYESGKTREKGTEVIIEACIGKEHYLDLRKGLVNEIGNSSAYITTPLYVNNHKMNREFRIPHAKVQFHFGGGSDLEGILAITPPEIKNGNTIDKTFYAIFNRRLCIARENRPLFDDEPDLSIMLSSSHIDYTISRDAIIENTRYKQILRLLKEKKDQLHHIIAKSIATEEQFKVGIPPKDGKARFWSSSPSGEYGAVPAYADEHRKQPVFFNDSERLHFCGDEALFDKLTEYIKKKIAQKREPLLRRMKHFFMRKNGTARILERLPRELRHEKILTGIVYLPQEDRVGFKRYSLAEVLDQAEKEHCVLYTYVSHQRYIESVAKALLDRGKILLVNFEKHDPQKRLLELFSTYQEVRSKYSLPNYEDVEKLSPAERTFITELDSIIQKSPLKKHVAYTVMGTKQDVHKQNDVPLYFSSNVLEKGWGKRLFGVKRTFYERTKDVLMGKEKVVLTRNHEFVERCVALSQDSMWSFLPYVAVMTGIAYKLAHMHSALPKDMLQFIMQEYGEQLKGKEVDMEAFMSQYKRDEAFTRTTEVLVDER
ncbi:MAG: ATP-binding protein [archaeon]